MTKNSVNKKQRIIRRFRNRCSIGAKLNQKQIDMEMIDLVLEKLYNGGDKQTASLKEDVLQPAKVNFTQQGLDRLWDILMSTGLVNPVIGFGRSGRLSLTGQGYALMTQFGSYSNFIQQREQQAAQQAGNAAAQQFILRAAQLDAEDDASTEKDDNQKVAKKKGNAPSQKPNDDDLNASVKPVE